MDAWRSMLRYLDKLEREFTESFEACRTGALPFVCASSSSSEDSLSWCGHESGWRVVSFYVDVSKHPRVS